MLKFILLSLAFLGLFALAELLYRHFKVHAEHSRKLVHVGTGLLTLLFPLMLRSHWEVMFLCASFALILFGSQRLHLLPSINAIKRYSHGSLCYPLAVWFSFWTYEQMAQQSGTLFPPLYYFYLPVLTMALGDPAAALVGRKWPLVKFRVGSGTKSLGGMLAFCCAAFLLVGGFLYFAPPAGMPLERMLLTAGVISVVACLAEALTPWGLDNITIPLIVIVVLYFLDHG